ncbi:MAG: cell division protein FtsK, partial [Oscillochloris sp.]|nr:cell division protein FtsK [Oscillochloris sp.]
MTVAAPAKPVSPDQPTEQAPALFNRPPRVLLTLPPDTVEIPGPPQAPAQRVGVRLISIMIPLASSLLYLVIAVARSGLNGGGLLSTLPVVGIALLTGGAAYYTFRQQQRDHARAVEAYKESYQQALERTRRRLQQLERQQRSYYEENNPDLNALLQIARGERNRDGVSVAAARLWERRPRDADFLCLRVGRGDRPTSLTIKPPSVNAYSKDVEDSLLLADQFRFVRDVPIDVNLRAVGSLGIAGPSGRSLNILQA